MQTKKYQCPFCGDGAFIGTPAPGHTKHVCQHCKGTANTAPTPTDLADPQPARCEEPALVGERQVQEKETWRIAELEAAISLLHELENISCDRFTAGFQTWSRVEGKLRAIIEADRRSIRIAAGGATAHIGPLPNAKLT